MKEGEINYNKEVFLHPWNLAFLITAMAGAFGISFIPFLGSETLFESLLIFTFALELLILGYVPRQKRFRRIIDAKYAAERAKPPTQRELYRQLSRINQRRYARLRDLQKTIEGNYRKFSYASQGLLESHIGKIDGLLNSCLSLLFQQERYALFGQQVKEQELLTDIASLQTEMEQDSDRIRNIKARRVRVLEQRLDRFKKSQEQLEIIDAQVETIEDVVKYIHEQSMTLRNPEEITYQLDLLLSEVEDTEASVSQIESVFSPAGDAAPPEDEEDNWARSAAGLRARA